MVLLRHKPWRRSIFSATFALFFYFFFFPTDLCNGLVVKSVEGVGRGSRNLRGQAQAQAEEEQWDGGQQQQQQQQGVGVGVGVVSQQGRVLVGPGSSPPTCRSRCGRCLPCRPVHVVIQPGRNSPLEYYPEAWRCKCGNKIFMP